MPVKLTFVGRPSIETSDDVITLGSDPKACVSFPPWVNVKSKHAVIRSVSDRWFIEAREGESITVNGGEATRVGWLNNGDQIRLSAQSAVFTFEVDVKPSKVEIADPDAVHFEAAEDQAVGANAIVFAAVPVNSAPVKPVRVQSVEVPPLHDEPLVPATVGENNAEALFLSDSQPVVPVRKQERTQVAEPRRSDAAPPSREISSSGSIPVYKPSHSDTVSFSDEKATTDPELKVVKKARPKRKAEPVVPTLQRLNYDETADVDFDDPFAESRPRRITPEQEEMRWVIMVVTRCVVGGLAVIALMMLIRWLARAFAPTPF